MIYLLYGNQKIFTLKVNDCAYFNANSQYFFMTIPSFFLFHHHLISRAKKKECEMPRSEDLLLHPHKKKLKKKDKKSGRRSFSLLSLSHSLCKGSNGQRAIMKEIMRHCNMIHFTPHLLRFIVSRDSSWLRRKVNIIPHVTNPP